MDLIFGIGTRWKQSGTQLRLNSVELRDASPNLQDIAESRYQAAGSYRTFNSSGFHVGEIKQSLVSLNKFT
jgi:hypothetical protein